MEKRMYICTCIDKCEELEELVELEELGVRENTNSTNHIKNQ